MLKSTARLLLIGFVFTVLYLGVSRVLALGADGEIHELARWVLFEMRRSDALQQRRQEMTEAMQLKKVITEEYIAGRLRLQEAAKQFRAADAIVQHDSEGLVAAYLMPETEHGLCMQVQVWTEIALSDGYSSLEAEEVRCRLEEELNELFPSPEPLVE